MFVSTVCENILLTTYLKAKDQACIDVNCKKFLKEKEKGLTARPLKLICHLNVGNAPLKVTKWLKNGGPLQVSPTNRIDKENVEKIYIF